MDLANRQDETAAAILLVKVYTPQNDYVYRPRNLLISYISGGGSHWGMRCGRLRLHL